MSNNNSNSGCVSIIVLICGGIAAVMAFIWITKGAGEIIKESPGGFFVVMVVIAIIGIAWLTHKE